MKKFSLINVIKQTAGFTMIELLIVIAILGILATAVLSAINPIEQINRGRDTGSRSDAEQLIGAIDRFYTFQNYYPWMRDITDDSLIDTLLPINEEWLDGGTNGGCGTLEKLSAGDPDADDECPGSNELKQGFVQKLSTSNRSYNKLYVYKHTNAPSDSVYICFIPQSGAFKQEAVKRCNDFVTGGGAPADWPETVCGTNDIDGDGVDDYLICLP